MPALSVYGGAPKWNNITEFDEWWSTLVVIKDNSTEQIIQLGKMNDYVIVFHGIRSGGKFIVRIHKDLPLEEKMRLVNETTNRTSNNVPAFSVVTSIGVISLLLLSKKYL